MKSKNLVMAVSAFMILIICVVGYPNRIYAEGVDLGGATSVSLGTTVNGTISEEQMAKVYQFQLTTAGMLTLDMESRMKYYTILIYDTSGDCVWYTDDNTWNENLKYVKNAHEADLKSGSYYLRVTGYRSRYEEYDYYASTGTYALGISFKSAGETMSEPNNEFSTASALTLNGKVNGQIASNDIEDIYKFSLTKSGRITLDITSYMKYYTLIVYDETGEFLWCSEDNTWNENLKYRSDEYLLDLPVGNYYLRVTGYKSRSEEYDYYASTGNYTFTTKFEESGETITEPNNDFANAYALSLNKTVTGQIAISDEYDICKFTLTKSMDLGIYVASYMEHYVVEIFDADGKSVWNHGDKWNENVGYRIDNLNVSLEAGTYYLKVSGDDYYRSTGNYKLCLNSLTSLKKATVVLKASQAAYTGKYITPSVKVTYNGKTLKKGSDYTVSYYDNYYVGKATVEISGIGAYTGTKKTSFVIVPTAPDITYAYNSGKCQACLEWNSVYRANGYEVYQSAKKSSGFKRRMTLNSTGVFIGKLKKGKTYYFKVRPYVLVDGKKYYGKFSKVRAIKIKK